MQLGRKNSIDTSSKQKQTTSPTPCDLLPTTPRSALHILLLWGIGGGHSFQVPQFQSGLLVLEDFPNIVIHGPAVLKAIEGRIFGGSLW